jgi:hypothetical protein
MEYFSEERAIHFEETILKWSTSTGIRKAGFLLEEIIGHFVSPHQISPSNIHDFLPTNYVL